MEPGFGRGRGRGRLPEGITLGIPLRRPSNFKDDSLSSKLHSLAISSDGDLDGVNEIVNTIKKMSETEEQLRKNVTALHDYALTGRTAAIIAGKICGKLSQFEVQEVKFRNLLLEKAQKDFQDKDMLKETSLVKFHSAIVFLTEIFDELKFQDGSPILVLATPICHYLLMLLQSSIEDDILLFCDQMSRIGKQLLKVNRKLFDEVLFLCRRTIIATGWKPPIRCRLLETLEHALTGFTPLSSDVANLYKELAR